MQDLWRYAEEDVMGTTQEYQLLTIHNKGQNQEVPLRVKKRNVNELVPEKIRHYKRRNRD